MASGFDWKRSLHPVPLWLPRGALRRYSAPVGRSCGRRLEVQLIQLAVSEPGAGEEHLPALRQRKHGERGDFSGATEGSSQGLSLFLVRSPKRSSCGEAQ